MSVFHAKLFNTSHGSTFTLYSSVLNLVIHPFFFSQVLFPGFSHSTKSALYVLQLLGPPNLLCFWLSKQFGSHIWPCPNCAPSAYLPPAWCDCCPIPVIPLLSGSKPPLHQSSPKFHPTSYIQTPMAWPLPIPLWLSPHTRLLLAYLAYTVLL